MGRIGRGSSVPGLFTELWGWHGRVANCRRFSDKRRVRNDVPEILLDDARNGRVRRYAGPVAIIRADAPHEVASALAAMEAALENGHHLAGYFSYELGYLLEPRLTALLPEKRDVPLLWFGVFKACEEFSGTAAGDLLQSRVRGRSYAGPLAHEWDEQAYRAKFDGVHDLIEAGDIYQANLIFRSRFAMVGDPMALYLTLRERSAAAHGAFIDDGERHILSLSPELSFRIFQDGTIEARPMKGTAPRGDNPAADAALRAQLQNSPKDRAENLMIVDLLRNDLARIAQTGSVRVDDLFALETYPTLHTMVSGISAKLRRGTSISQIVHALFPCGSVIGTPKIRAMEIIRAAEDSPRGVYCGAIGHFAPDGLAQFNVAIRTLTLSRGNGELGIGGAVVFDSRAEPEYAECLLKARYYSATRKPLELIETLRFMPGSGFIRLQLHLARMARSASAFGIAFDERDATDVLGQAVRGSAIDLRARLTLNERGALACTAAEIEPAHSGAWVYAISPIIMQSTDEMLRHKTSWRETYDTELARAEGCDEVLFVNECGRVTEGSRTNIFIRCGGKLLTPTLDDGVLDGCLRRELVDSGECIEQSMTLDDLSRADEVFLGNSLRGLMPARPRIPKRRTA